jgi:hypothetical protein
MSRSLFDTKDFFEWIQKQDPDRPYNYGNMYHCPIARYFKEKGFPNVKVTPDFVSLEHRFGRFGRKWYSLTKWWDWAVEGGVYTRSNAHLSKREHTYGAAQQRISKIKELAD